MAVDACWELAIDSPSKNKAIAIPTIRIGSFQKYSMVIDLMDAALYRNDSCSRTAGSIAIKASAVSEAPGGLGIGCHQRYRYF